MFWYCDECNDWGVSATEVDAAVDRQRHLDAHLGREGPAPASEEGRDEDTVLTFRYVAWGTTALLGLLSTRFPSLLGVAAVCALLTFVVTGVSDD